MIDVKHDTESGTFSVKYRVMSNLSPKKNLMEREFGVMLEWAKNNGKTANGC